MTLATEVRIPMIRPALAAAACALALVLVACGDDDDKSDGSTTSEATAQGADLAAVKDYLLSHTERLVEDSGAVRANAEAYYDLAKSNDFDYGALLEQNRAKVRELVVGGQEAFAKANPAYEPVSYTHLTLPTNREV